jgi:hypothetical protein
MDYKYGRTWHTVDAGDGAYHREVIKWCKAQFGSHPLVPDSTSRWFNSIAHTIHFRDEEDLTLFLLRWS